MTDDTNHEELMLYWSGELDEAAARKVKERLRNDPEAVAYLAELNQLQHHVKDVPREHPERSLIPAPVASNESAEQVVSYPAWQRFVPIAVAVAVVIGIGLFQLLRNEDLPAPPPITSSSSASPMIEVSPSDDKLSTRLFSSQKRFTSSLRLDDAQERVKRIRTQLNTNSI